MRQKIILLAIAAMVSVTAFARPRTRGVTIDTVCHTPVNQLLQVVDSFCYQFQACPDSLFLWAYLGLEEHVDSAKQKRNKEGRDVIHLEYKDRVYNAQDKIGDVAIDIYVLGMRWWKDQHLITAFTTNSDSYTTVAHLSATYSGSILDDGHIIYQVHPISDNETAVHYEFYVTLGGTLAAFISDKTWQNSAQWRFEAILENIIECAETGTVTMKERGPKHDKHSKQ